MSSALDGVQCVILVGGLGTRLRPLVADRPKSMALVGRQPFLAIVIHLLQAQGISRFLLCTGYKGEMISSYFGDGSPWQVQIHYSDEGDARLGTAGALRHALPKLDRQFLALNGDTYLAMTYRDFWSAHLAARPGALMSMALCSARADDESAGRSGNVSLDTANRVSAFSEKQQALQTVPRWLNAGVYAMQRTLVEEMSPGKTLSLEREVLPDMILRGDIIMGYPTASHFYDIGTPESLHAFQDYFAGQPG